MPLVISNAGEKLFNDAVTAVCGKVWLYKSNTTPSATSVKADFTLADYGGAAAQSITWNDSDTNGSGKAEAVADTLTFEASSGSNTIYGYIVTKTGDDSVLVYAEKFATARTIDSDTDLTLTPKLTYASEN